jgi:hypothetical protein
MITRTTLLSGPAAATFRGHTLFAQKGILVTPALGLEVVDSDAQGVLDATATGEPVMITFAPSAPFADLLALYPYTMGTAGMSLFGTADSPLVLVAANGVRLTFSAVAIVQMPDLTLSASGAVAGAVTFLALGARALPVTAANRVVTIDTADFPALPTSTPQLADDFSITWGADGTGSGAPWTKLQALDGITVQFKMQTRSVVSAANALLDVTLDSLAVTVTFTPGSPSGPVESDIFSAMQVQGELPGRLLSAGAQTLDIAGEHLWVRLPLAQLTAGPLLYDATKPRVGKLVFTATRAVLGAGSTAEALVSLTEGRP